MHLQNTERATKGPNFTPEPPADSWSARYGERHRLRRITDFPAGVTAPSKARIYARNGHFIVQWWDRGAQRNLCERVDGDLIDAIGTARRVEERLVALRTANHAPRRLKHAELIEKFLADLQRRADAGEVAPTTVTRYRSALAHYAAFTATPEVATRLTVVSHVDRQFALDFAAFLSSRVVAPNGHARAAKRRLRGQAFVLDAVRAMLEWANDPDRGGCLPEGFRNPFRRATLDRRSTHVDPLAAPDVTMEMAVAFIAACDDYQRALFAPLLLYGLRASEPVFLFREHVSEEWLRIACVPELAYTTKGIRNKSAPLLPVLAELWGIDPAAPGVGLLLHRRAAIEGKQAAPLRGSSLAQLAAEFEQRCLERRVTTAADRQRVRDDIVRDAGGLTYDLINGEFRRVVGKLNWPKQATLKDFRHLFASVMSDAGFPEPARRYLLGHAPSRDAITKYTHLINISKHFHAVVESQWAEVMAILQRSCCQ